MYVAHIKSELRDLEFWPFDPNLRMPHLAREIFTTYMNVFSSSPSARVSGNFTFSQRTTRLHVVYVPPMGAQRHGEGGIYLPPSGNVVKCFCALIITAKRPVRIIYAIFSQTVLSFSGASPPDPHRSSIPGPRFVSRPLICPPLEKILPAPMVPPHHRRQSSAVCGRQPSAIEVFQSLQFEIDVTSARSLPVCRSKAPFQTLVSVTSFLIH